MPPVQNATCQLAPRRLRPGTCPWCEPALVLEINHGCLRHDDEAWLKGFRPARARTLGGALSPCARALGAWFIVSRDVSVQ